ncbi:MAG: DUF6089 family protein [Bacteroidales bacterium]
MRTRYKIFLFLILLILLLTPAGNVSGQEENIYEDMLREEVETINPTYMPVIGIGTGYINFMGDVKNNVRNPVVGNLGLKVNISTFVDNRHFYKANFFLLYGSVTGNQRSLVPDENLNFQSSLVNLGVNIDYSFGNFFKRPGVLRPFISLGLENLQFNTKGDLMDAANQTYFYWSDGTIRNNRDGVYPNSVIYRDYTYESDLRELDTYGKGSYSQNAFALPVDAGLDFQVSSRVNLRLGYAMHFTFTDYLDNVAGDKNMVNSVNVGGNTRNDWFSYSYVSMHFDLFSDPKTKIVEKMFVMLDDFDYTMMDDDDNDGVWLKLDRCPDTPPNAKVDSVGCPLDDDRDGVPDYLDNESSTLLGAIVDENGVTLQDAVVDSMLSQEAIQRSEVAEYFRALASQKSRVHRDIPEKFKFLDTDKDKEISFDEVLTAIDRFFDFDSSLSTSDIYELNDFFFSQ